MAITEQRKQPSIAERLLSGLVAGGKSIGSGKFETGIERPSETDVLDRLTKERAFREGGAEAEFQDFQRREEFKRENKPAESIITGFDESGKPTLQPIPEGVRNPGFKSIVGDDDFESSLAPSSATALPGSNVPLQDSQPLPQKSNPIMDFIKNLGRGFGGKQEQAQQAPQASNAPNFASIDEALAANLPKGTPITINGRSAIVE